ncbi:MAG TPA: NAD(P)/FAD-dependent oxidoreductase [Miltoncostaeaceae bacterium]|nr:NAD(P)/FAD-dependent oxidoreductase [Miltoncostaeaceae bacterium]
MSDDARPTRVVIIGGGFGGLFTALALERAQRRGGPELDVTLVHDSNAMVYTPFLPQAAGGTLEPRHVVVPLRGPLRRTAVLVGAAVSHDAEARTIEFRSEAGDHRSLPYDHLVAAPGSVSRTLPVPGLKEAALGFKTVAEAIALRNQALKQLERAEAADDPQERAARLTFVFVGGGYAGVEAMAEVEDLIRDAKRLHPALEGDRARFVLVEATDAILPEVGQRLSSYALRELDRRGIELRLGTTIADATGGGVTLSSGERIPCHTLVWTTGVRTHPTMAMLGLPVDERGRARVDATTAVEGRPGTWALGDSAAVPDPARPGMACPPTSQHAVRQARITAHNIIAAIQGREPDRFTYRSLGVFVDLGRGKAVASVLGLQFRGFPAWFLGRGYHLSQVPGLARKGRVAIDWAVSLLFPRDTAELGTLGHPPPLDVL